MKTRVTALIFLALCLGSASVLAQDTFLPPDATDISGKLKAVNIPYHAPAESFYVYVPNRIVVQLGDPVEKITLEARTGISVTGCKELDELNKKFGVTMFDREFPGSNLKANTRGGPDLSRYYLVQFSEKYKLDEVMKAYEGCKVVVEAEPVGVHPIYESIPNDTYFQSDQWNYYSPDDHDVDATDAWDHETGSPTVILGCLDTGVGWTSRDLGGLSPYTDGNIWINEAEYNGVAGVDDDGNGFVDDWVGWDFVNGASPCYSGEDCTSQDNQPSDFNGHGTHVAGIMGAITNNGIGVAGTAGGWNTSSTAPANGVKIMALRVGWSAPHPVYGEVGYVRMDFAAQAVYYAVNNGATAINCSWGSSNSGGLAAAMDYATAHGVIIVAAAGNDGTNSPDYLGTRTDVVNVCATDTTDVKADFSDFGAWVDIAAPGTNILSTYSNHGNTGYIAWISGTSQASPHVCGAAGLLKSYDESLTRDDIVNLLVGYTDNIDALNPTYAGLLGSGRLNLFKAIDAAGAPEVTVIQPNGGEVLYIGQVYTIMWDATDNVGIASTSIDYSVNSGVDWMHVADLVGNPGEYDWTVTGPPSSTCRMRVTCTDAVGVAGSDMSDEDFCPPFKTSATRDFAIKGAGPLPISYTLQQNYPNPFNPATEISFDLPEETAVRLEVFNVLGQQVATLIDSRMEAGSHTVEWQADGFASGLYLYRLTTRDFVSTKKMLLLK